MDVLLMILVGIPVAAIVTAFVVQLRREARDRRLENHESAAGATEHLDGNVEVRAAAHAAFMVRGGGTHY